jgi:hypothetical protein
MDSWFSHVIGRVDASEPRDRAHARNETSRRHDSNKG